MAGRAGRRGIDTIGHVVHCNNLFDLPSENEYKTVLHGSPQELVSKFRMSYSLFLGQMIHGPKTVSEFLDFVQKSMLFQELEETIVKQKAWIAEKEVDCLQKTREMDGLQTPPAICRRYSLAEESMQMATNKRKKEYERELERIRSDYPSYKSDAEKVKQVDRMIYDIKQDQEELLQLEAFFHERAYSILSLLVDDGYATRSEDFTQYELTPLGNVAAALVEVHPLIMAKRFAQWKWFSDFSIDQMIGLMACFTDVNMREDRKHCYPISKDGFLKARMQELVEEYANYEKKEQERDLRTGIQYEDALNFDMCDLAISWTECTEELSCKQFIQHVLIAEYGISIGDFTKAMLKVSTIAKEWSLIAEAEGQVEWLYKLSQVDSCILKYVTTCQSLYL
jgi:superfamily II RNA helicase